MRKNVFKTLISIKFQLRRQGLDTKNLIMIALRHYISRLSPIAKSFLMALLHVAGIIIILIYTYMYIIIHTHTRFIPRILYIGVPRRFDEKNKKCT